MIDTLMALWNRNNKRRGAKVLLAFLLICISISLLLAVVGVPHLTIFLDRGVTAWGIASQADSTSVRTKSLATATVPNVITSAATPISAETVPARASATAKVATPTTSSNAMQTCNDAPVVSTPAQWSTRGNGAGNGRSATTRGRDTRARTTHRVVATPTADGDAAATATVLSETATPDDVPTPIKAVAVTQTPVIMTPTAVPVYATPPAIFIVPTPTPTAITPTVVSSVTPTPTQSTPSGTTPTPTLPLAPHGMVSAIATPSVLPGPTMHGNVQRSANVVAVPTTVDQRIYANDGSERIDSGVSAKCLTDSIAMAPLPTAAVLSHGVVIIMGGAFLGTILFYGLGYMISRRRVF